ncbi:MAG TPA: hypothetical protein VF488_13305, partial [Gemmatimonadaceae bacterium]
MPLRIAARRADLASLDVPLLVIALAKGATAGGALAPLDAALGGALGRTLERRDFRGTRDETLHLAGAERGPRRIL